MLKLNASYSKKIPVPGEQFSSQSFHCSVEVELSETAGAEQLQGKIQETFNLVRSAVETELNGSSGKAPIHVLPENPNGTAEPAPKASNRQVKYVLDLAKQHGLGLSELNARIQQTFGVPTVYHLDRKAASRLVDQLKAA